MNKNLVGGVGKMHIVSAINGKNPYNSDRTSGEYTCINSCGHYKFTYRDSKYFAVSRRKGRSDYQLLYFGEGNGSFYLNGKNVKVDEGNIVIYKPYQPQIYNYIYPADRNKNTEVFWIHFTGRCIEELLKKSGLWDKQIYYIGKCNEVTESFLKIIREIQVKSYQYELFCSAYFNELLAHISRRIMYKNNINQKYNKLIESIIESMHNNYSSDQSVEYYAKQCNLSKYYFIHLFKQCTGLSPYAYKTKIRIEKSKELLTNTTLNIGEIATAVGYDNPLYFSKLFKKNTSKSPLAYRKSLL